MGVAAATDDAVCVCGSVSIVFLKELGIGGTKAETGSTGSACCAVSDDVDASTARLKALFNTLGVGAETGVAACDGVNSSESDTDTDNTGFASVCSAGAVDVTVALLL